ncbi:MAG: DNA polymerase domain-containing protein [Acidimicrobiales bacterium]
MADDGVVLEAAGHQLTLTHPDKVFFAERGETKLDLVRYYEAVAGPLLAAIGGRPVLLQRFPNGAGNQSFFQKRVPALRPEWLQTAVVSTPNGTTSDALVVADLAHVYWAVNLACLGFHVWPTRAADLEHADELRIDLDPRELERRRPDLITAAWWKEERGTRVFVDFNQNAPHKTIFGAWSVRARAGAQVSTPFGWDELATIDIDALTMVTVPARVAEAGDPWSAMDAAPQSLEPVLDLHRRDQAAGLSDAPWPPVYPKMPGEPPRVAPSRAKKT